MKIKLTITILIGLSIFLVVINQAVASDHPWPMFQYDEKHTGQSPYLGPETSNVKWIFDAGSELNYAPAVSSDSTLYLSSANGLHALNSDGTQKWLYELPWTAGTPAIDEQETIYAVFNQGIAAINPNNTLKWQNSLPVVYASSTNPVIGQDGNIYLIAGYEFPDTTNHLCLISVETEGAMSCLYELAEEAPPSHIPQLSPPAIDQEGTFYFGYDYQFFAINSDGTLKWKLDFPDYPITPATISSDGTIYVSAGGQFLAISPDGQILWSLAVTAWSWINAPAALSPDGTIYVSACRLYQGLRRCYLYAFDDQGTLKWERHLSGYPYSYYSAPLVDSQGIVYVVALSNLRAYNPDGDLLWSVSTGHNARSLSLDQNQTIYSPGYPQPGIAGLYAVGLEIPVNQPPTLSNLNQYKSDIQTEIPEGGITTESIIVFKATVTDPENDQVKLQIELKEFNQSFDETDLLESDFIQSGNEAMITVTDLTDGQYKWRARAVDSNEAASDWQEFGTAGNVDFEVQLPLSTKAAMLAKELVNYPYLYGGKGWDYNLSQFVAVDTIKTGYVFWNKVIESTDFGAGVDCSGLIMWTYDRSFDPLESPFDNFVKVEGADGQYRYNTIQTTEAQLKPGDVMFFDDVPKDGFIDHVTMYVGESSDFNVVNAADIDRGIISASKDDLKQLPKFVAFKQVVSAPQPTILVSTYSPVDFAVTDPDGFIITPETIIPSELEYLREIPGVLYYSEIERSADGNPIDQVYSYTPKTGNYLITVLPEPDALPTDTYTLEVKTLINGEIVTTVLAENVPIDEIPEQTYLVKVTETEVIPVTPMRSFAIKEMKINWAVDYPGERWRDKTTFTISGSLELPDEYQKEDLNKSTFLSIQIADKLGKDKIILKELKNTWFYQEPWKRQKTDDSLNQGIDIKTAVINWIEEKKCRFFNWWCKERFQKNWFYIRGEISLEGIDVNTLPREATVILEIPTTSNEETNILAGIETIEFKKFHQTWFYNSFIKWKNWQDSWWEKWDNDGFNWGE